MTSMAEPGGPEGGGGGEGDDVVECVVEFDYIAELNDELTLRVSFFLQFCNICNVFLNQVGDVIMYYDVVECVVEFDYIAELNDELTLRVGFFLQFIFYVICSSFSGW